MYHRAVYLLPLHPTVGNNFPVMRMAGLGRARTLVSAKYVRTLYLGYLVRQRHRCPREVTKEVITLLVSLWSCLSKPCNPMASHDCGDGQSQWPCSVDTVSDPTHQPAKDVAPCQMLHIHKNTIIIKSNQISAPITYNSSWDKIWWPRDTYQCEHSGVLSW